MSVVTLPIYVRPAVSIPPYPYYVVSPFLAPTAYDTAQKVMDIADGQMTSNITGDTLSLNVGVSDYAYLFSPVANGAISFNDLANNMPGGWDGASWPDGDIGENYGPQIISLDFGAGAEAWYVYRTDFTGAGNRTWKLTYAR